MKKTIALILSATMTIHFFMAPYTSVTACAKGIDDLKNTGSTLIDNAKKTGKTAKESAEKASKTAKDTADTISQNAEKAGKTAKETADTISKNAKKAEETTRQTAEKASKTAKDTAEKASKAAKDTSEKAKAVSDTIKKYAAKIDTKKFKSGWDYASKYTGTTIAALKGKTYVNSVQSSITDTSSLMQKELLKKVNSNNGFASSNSDFDNKYGSNYYKTSKPSAKTQAINFFEDYQRYYVETKQNGGTPMNATEYLGQYEKKNLDAIYDSLYTGKNKPASYNKYGLLTPKYILKQAIGAGAQAAIINTAFAIGPDVYAILVDAAKTGKIDEKKLMETGIEGVLAGSEGFVEGSVSSAIVIASQSGKFGRSYKNLAPETVGTLTVLIVDSIRYGYQLSEGQITEEEYGDLMAQEIIIALASQTTGALVQALFPFIPFAYVAGSMAGAMLASAGYSAGKDLILEVRGENGFETVVPESHSSGQSLATSFMSNIKLKDTISEFKHKTVATIGNGKIKVSI